MKQCVRGITVVNYLLCVNNDIIIIIVVPFVILYMVTVI